MIIKFLKKINLGSVKIINFLDEKKIYQHQIV
jgi:hypothetical protein